MENLLILLILAVLLIFAILRTVRHFKGGGCCSGGTRTIRDKKTLSKPVIGQKILTIQGMTCENCEIRVQNALNRLDDVLCKVDRKKKIARVSFSSEVSNELLRQTVETLGYTVTGIEDVF